ncbi:MAG: hypothetical protein H6819_10250 [Phycisphaerales bacterium]|nr:hypothetical protein [Phycisphaerales bacterium]MCB9856596.1 hypothetical protein [Phycisphaerales bacterium]MCB9864607.1 hypothetical protein [Phycisphaerales bacterium]
MTSRSTRFCGLVTAFAVVALFAPRLSADSFTTQLGGDGFDVEIDEVRDLAYVSVPSTNEVVFVSLSTFTIVDSVNVGANPYGLSLSHDNSTLYVALNGAGNVAKLDIDAQTFTTHNFTTLLDDGRTYDVVEAQPGIVFISANPSSSGFARIVRWDVVADTAARVANNRIIRAAPVFAVSPDETFLVVGEGFSPNSLYRLDITQTSAPIVAEDNHGSVNGTRRIAMSPDGTFLATSTGQIIDSETLDPIGNVGSGAPGFGNSAESVYMAIDSDLTAYDVMFGNAVGQRTLACGFDVASQVRVSSDEMLWLVLGDDTLCAIANEPFCNMPPPAPSVVSPAHEATGVSIVHALTWQTGASVCTPTYDVLFGDSNPPTGLIAEDKALPICNPGSLQPNTTYYWQVIARHDGGATPGPVWSFTTGPCAAPVPAPSGTVNLPSNPFDFVYDASRQQIYVSLPDLHEVDVISTQTYGILDRLRIGVGPRGLDLSADNSKLYAALYRGGGIAILDIDSGSVTEISLTAELDDYRTWDVIERGPDDVFVSSNPGSNGFAYVVRVDTEAGTAARVASGRIIRGSPTFEVSPDGQFVYVSEGFSPNSLYKLNAATPTAPIVEEDDHGSVSGTDVKAVSPNGDRIVLRSGQVIDTADISVARTLATSGRPAFADDPSIVYLGTGTVVNAYDIYSGAAMGQFPLACTGITRLLHVSNETGWAAIGTNRLSYRAGPIAAPGAPTPVLPENGAADQPNMLSLSWTFDDACTDATFDVLLDTQTPPIATACENVIGTSCDVALDTSTTYYWQVLASNDAGTTAGPIWSFTTVDCRTAPAPSDPQPADMESNVPIDTGLSWSGAEDRSLGLIEKPVDNRRSAAGRLAAASVTPADQVRPPFGLLGDPCPIRYSVYFGTQSPPTNLVCSDLEEPHCDLPEDLVEGETYYWQVVSTTCCDERSGPIWQFTVAGDFRFEPVVLSSPTNYERGDLPPNASACIGVQDSFFVEIWGSDIGAVNTGIVCAFVNVDLPADVSLIDVIPSPNFTNFVDWELVGSQLRGVGGCGIPNGGVGVDEWARIATLKLSANACLGGGNICLSSADQSCSAFGRGAVPDSDVSFDCADLCIDEDCLYDLSGDGFVDDDDFDIFMPCFNCTGEDSCWNSDACEYADFDCSGVVDPGDVGWFAGGYLRSCASIMTDDLPPCRQCVIDLRIASPQDIAEVEFARRIVDNRRAGRLTQRTGTADPITLELLVRDLSTDSHGIAAAYFDVELAGASLVDVRFDGAFDRLHILDDSRPDVVRVGAATLTPGAGIDGWTRVATLEIGPKSAITRADDVVVRTAPNGIALIGGRIAEVVDRTDDFAEGDDALMP